jgi:hypothetical protein
MLGLHETDCIGEKIYLNDISLFQNTKDTVTMYNGCVK